MSNALKEGSSAESLNTKNAHVETHFGYRQVPLEEKKKLVGEVFSSVAQNYDIMNDLMSLGIHRYWKKCAIEQLDIAHNKPLKILDLAGGTGDLSVLLSKKINAQSQIVLADINYEMVSIGRSQRINQGHNASMDYTIANAENLPYPDNSFNRVIIGFGLRNVTDKQQALNEMFRVLSPGGKLLVLEFSEVQNKTLSAFYNWYSFSILPLLGKAVANDAESYQYLAESIRKHPNQVTLLSMIDHSGFTECSYENFLQGAVAMHTGIKQSLEENGSEHNA